MDWEMWKSMQHSMALEGFEISDEKLKSLARKFKQEGYESLSDRIIALVSDKDFKTDFKRNVLHAMIIAQYEGNVSKQYIR